MDQACYFLDAISISAAPHTGDPKARAALLRSLKAPAYIPNNEVAAFGEGGRKCCARVYARQFVTASEALFSLYVYEPSDEQALSARQRAGGRHVEMDVVMLKLIYVEKYTRKSLFIWHLPQLRAACFISFERLFPGERVMRAVQRLCFCGTLFLDLPYFTLSFLCLS